MIPKRSLLIIALLVILEAGGTVLIPEVRKYLYDVLGNKSLELFHIAIFYVVALSFGLDLIVSFKRWAVLKISFRFRESKYRLLRGLWSNEYRPIPNYSTAMTNALSLSTESYLNVSIEMFISAIIVLVLIGQYWHMPTILLLSIGYTVAVCVAALFFNRPLVSSDKNNIAAEGQHRETITILENEIKIEDKWGAVVITAMRKFRVNFLFTLFTRFKGSVATILGLLILAPKYFTGELSLGDFMAAVAVFELIVGNTTYIINLYPQYTAAKASSAIIKQFEGELNGS